MKVKNIRTLNRLFLTSKVRRSVFFHYLALVFKSKLTFKQYRLLIKRINFLLKSFKYNKFYKVGKRFKLDNSVPLFGTESFYKYMDKFKVFDDKLACSTALISISKDCSFNCKHCYQKFDKGEDISIDKIKEAVEYLIESGVSAFVIEGGDPFIQFDRLLTICRTIGNKAEITINSTGDGITLERLKKLQSCCNLFTITFSNNSPLEEDINFFMGQDYAWNTIKHGMKLCNIASIPVSLNCCLHSGHYENGNFEYLMEIAKNSAITHVKLIHPKAAGAWLNGEFPEFTKDEIEHIKSVVKKYNKHRKFAKYPAITAQVIDEDEEHYGCRAGGSDLLYINAKGDVQPCEFLNLSYGNIGEKDFKVIFEKMREDFHTPGTKWLCEAYTDRIHSEFKTSEVLPVSAEATRKLSEKWDRGDATPLYYRIEKELVE